MSQYPTSRPNEHGGSAGLFFLPKKITKNIFYNVSEYAMFGTGIIARRALTRQNMGVATKGSGAAKCVLGDVLFKNF